MVEWFTSVTPLIFLADFGDILVTGHLKDFFYFVYKEDYMEEIKISLILHARI